MHLNQLEDVGAIMMVKYFWLALSALVLCTMVAGLPSLLKVPRRKHGNAAPKPNQENHGAKTDNSEASKEARCKAMIGKIVNDKFVGTEVEYDLAKILEQHGGPPGKVNTTWTEKDDAPVKDEDFKERPLPDAERKFWVYNYRDTDYKTYVRTEHAVHRFRGTLSAFLEIRGTVYFTPDDFCGKARVASYSVDDRGFNFKVNRLYCEIGAHDISCTGPMACKTDSKGQFPCEQAPTTTLIASLVGQGKKDMLVTEKKGDRRP